MGSVASDPPTTCQPFLGGHHPCDLHALCFHIPPRTPPPAWISCLSRPSFGSESAAHPPETAQQTQAQIPARHSQGTRPPSAAVAGADPPGRVERPGACKCHDQLPCVCPPPPAWPQPAGHPHHVSPAATSAQTLSTFPASRCMPPLLTRGKRRHRDGSSAARVTRPGLKPERALTARATSGSPRGEPGCVGQAGTYTLQLPHPQLPTRCLGQRLSETGPPSLPPSAARHTHVRRSWNNEQPTARPPPPACRGATGSERAPRPGC